MNNCRNVILLCKFTAMEIKAVITDIKLNLKGGQAPAVITLWYVTALPQQPSKLELRGPIADLSEKLKFPISSYGAYDLSGIIGRMCKLENQDGRLCFIELS